MKIKDLKPCPFCGKTDNLRIIDTGYLFVIGCFRCGVALKNHRDKSKLVDMWNTRVGEKTFEKESPCLAGALRGEQDGRLR